MPLPNIEEISQKVLAVPVDVLGIEARHMQERMSTLSQGIGQILPAGADLSGMTLPQLPDIFAGKGIAAPSPDTQLQGASTLIQGQKARAGEPSSYLEV